MRTWFGMVVAVAAVGCGEGVATGATGFDSGTFTVQPGPDAGGNAPVECITDAECGADSASCELHSCVAGKCEAGVKPAGTFCDGFGSDASKCRMTRCDWAGACIVAPAIDGTRCGTLNACEQQACVEGVCSGAAATECDDGNLCTTDSCDVATGCTYTPNTVPCDDGDSCSTGEACAQGECKGGTLCECRGDADCALFDTNKCDGQSTCVSGKCENDPKTAKTCPVPIDGTQCEVSECQPATGECVKSIKEYKSCEDGNVCTTEDYCTNVGVCISKKVTCEFLCGDDKDDDGDLEIDCLDDDCENDSACIASCSDGAVNGTETDLNCGGLCPKCALDKDCLLAADCESGFCDPTDKQCAPLDP